MMFAKRGEHDGGFLPIAFSVCYFLIHEAESWLLLATVLYATDKLHAIFFQIK